MATPLNIIGGWYSDESKPWAQQDICNYIPFAAERPGTLSPIKAVDAPGLKPFVEIASDGGIRGAKNAEGKLLVVAGTTLYQISNTGVAIPRGTIPGTGLVSIDYNQQGIANQVLIGNGSAGYVYDTSALTLVRITDPAFPGTKAVAYLDSYLLGVEPLGRFWFHSNLADAEDYNSLDRYEAETAPDRIVTLAVSNEEVVVFGQSTTDFFVNTGATTGTFQSKGVSMDVGCASAASVVKLDNTLFWLDNYGVFQRLNGYSPQPVSTRVLESAISGFDWSKCRASVHQDKGRKIAYWTFPGLLTIGYDVTTGLWHRRQAYGKASDRLSCIVNWNNLWIGGDYQSGRLYVLDWDYMLQVDQPHVRRVHTMPLQANGNRLNLHRLKLQFDTGGPETIAIPFPEQPDPPTISGDAPDGAIGVPWGPYTYTLSGGLPPYTVTLRSGSLPQGFGPISTDGELPAFTPLETDSGTFVLRVTDANGLYGELTDTINVTSNMLLLASRPPPAAGANRCIVRSTTGIAWNAAPTAPGAVPDGVEYILGLPDRILVYGASTDVYASTDFGATFPTSTADMAGQASHRGCYDPAEDVVYLPAGSGGLYRSVDRGANFTAVSGVTASDDAYVVGDIGFSLYNGSATFYKTADAGATWQSATNPFPGSGASSGRNRFATDGTLLLMSGERTLSGYSVVFIDQAGTIADVTPTLVTGTEIYAAGYGSGNWVVASDTGEIFYRPSLTTGSWITATDSLGVSPDSIKFNGAYTVIVGDDGGPTGDAIVKYSTDLDTWTPAPLNVPLDSFALAVQG